MQISIERIFAAFFAAASALALVVTRVVASYGTPESQLQAFYIEGLSRTFVEASALLFAAAVIFGIYATSASFCSRVHDVAEKIGEYLRACSLWHYAVISFSATAALLFLLNAPGIIYGTFLIDDYKMYAIATERSVWELFWIPINDHVIPLFWFELKAIFSIIGPNPPLLNFPLFFPAIVAIGGAAVLLRMLGFGPSTLFVLLGTFATTTVVSHQLYGFYAVAPYIQVLAIFTLSLICFVRAQQSKHFARGYLALSLLLLAMTLLLESGGVLTPIAYVLFIYSFNILHSGTWSIRSTLSANTGTLIAVLTIALSYAAYLIALPRYAAESFIGFDRLPITFDTVLELYHVLTAGTLLSLVAPRLGLIMSQPRLEVFIMPWWHIAMFALFCAFAALVVYAIHRGTLRMRVLVPYFALIMLGTALLVAIARPSSNLAAFYRDQNLLFPLFFLALALAVFAHEWIRSATQDTSRRARTAAVMAFLIVVFVSQHVFSFYKEQYFADITFNRSLIERMRETLTPALNELASSASAPLSVPSLSSFFVSGDGNYQVPELSAFSSFIGIQGVEWLPIQYGPYGASTSPAFIEALKHDLRLRERYLTNGEMYENCVSEPWGKDAISASPKKPVRLATSVDTARTHELHFDLEAHGAPEKIFIDLAFKNDFNATGTRAYIRLDQYTLPAAADERRYVCSVDLNEIPAFALSPRVSNLTMTITTPGEYILKGNRLESQIGRA